MNIKKHLPAIIISVSLLVIFILTGFMLKNVKGSLNDVKNDILEAEADKEAGALYKQFFANATFEEAQTESLKSETGEVLSSVKALENGNQVGIIYLIKVQGYKPDLHVYVAIDTVNKKVVNYSLGENNETPDKISGIPSSFKNQFVNSDITNPSLSYTTVATVTYSSKGIVEAVLLARQAYYQSIGEEVPVVKATLISIKSSFNGDALFDCVVEKDGTNYDVVLKYEKNKFSVVSGMDGFSETEVNFVLTTAKAKLPKAYVLKITDTGLTVATKGFSGYFNVDFTIENGQITNISVSSHGESYEYNSGYSPSNGDPIIDFGKEVIGNTNWEDYNVVGATVTTNSMKEAYKVAFDYLAQKEGK